MANKGKYLKLTCQKKDNNNRKTGDESISELSKTGTGMGSHAENEPVQIEDLSDIENLT